MTDDVHGNEPEEPYEAPKVEDIENERGPSVTSAGLTLTDT